jgi:hypothetical protein
VPDPVLGDGKKAKEQVLKWWKMFFCAIGIATTTSLKEGRALSIEDSGVGMEYSVEHVETGALRYYIGRWGPKNRGSHKRKGIM